MKIAILAGLMVTSLVSAQTLYQNFLDNWGYFPSLKERAPIYAEVSGEPYKGTAEQNKKLNEYLFEASFSLGSLAFPPSTVEGTSTAGWTDDGSIVRLNTAADSVGIGTANPSEKLSVVGGNAFISGNLSIGGGTFNFGNSSGTSTLSVTTNGRLGIGTTTPGTDFSVQGNSLTSGTTTAGGIVATSTLESKGRFIAATSTQLSGVIYHWPTTDGTSNDRLTTNGNGALSWTAVTNVQDWVQLVSTTTSIANPFIRPDSFAGRKHLRIVLQTTGLASAGTVSIRFNNDSGGNYYARDYTATGRAGWVFQNESLGGTEIGLVSSATTSPVSFDFFVPNIAGTQKTFSWNGALGNASAIPMPHQGAGTWQNTSNQITQVTILSGVNFNVNTRLTIYASSD